MGDRVCADGLGRVNPMENIINSTSNRQIRALAQLQTKAKARRAEGLFVAEGVRMYREVPRELLVKTYVSESFYEKEQNRALLKDGGVEVVSDRVFAAVSDTKTPQGILCLVRQRQYSVEEMLQKETPFLLLLEDIQDPGNLGTIFRTAEAAGVSGILMSAGTADIYNPKTIRSTMGAVYRMPFGYVSDFLSVPEKLRQRRVRTYAAHLNAKSEYTAQDYRTGCAFLIGNEGNGLSDALAAQADVRVKISMEGQAESLNAAVAAAILMFEAKRQRSGA